MVTFVFCWGHISPCRALVNGAAEAFAEMTSALKAGNVDALVELANTLQAATDNEKFVGLMPGLIFELLPLRAQKKILASSTSSDVIDLFTREPRE